MTTTKKSGKRVFSEIWVMCKRCLLTSLRNPDALLTAILVPAGVMWLFGTLYGSIVDVGDYNYIDFIVPGIILQTVAQGATATAICVNNDMTKGIIDRFRSMAIARSSVLTGHVVASIARNMITAAVAIAVAIAMGFRPQAGFLDWLTVVGVLLLFILSITWIAVISGLIAKTPESAGSMVFPLFILPYLSSGFAPTESMSGWFKWFAENQPMSPVIDSMRDLFMSTPTGSTLPIAVAWSVGIIIVAFTIAVQIFKRKLV